MMELLQRNYPTKEVISYLTSLFETAAQRSAAWFDSTKHSIGGSRAAALVNAHYSLKAHHLAQNILYPPPPLVPTLPLIMGTFFESLHLQLATIVLQAPIFEVGKFTASTFSHFSPDGIGIDPTGRVVLCEFKTPFVRRVNSVAYNIPYPVPTNYEIQCQYSMMLLPLIKYSYFQDLSVWIKTTDRCLSWINESALNNSRRKVGSGRIFGTASCKFYLPFFDGCKLLENETLHDLGALPQHLLLEWLLQAEQVQPWVITLTPYSKLQIEQFRRIFLNYPADLISMWDHHSTEVPAGIIKQPNCYLTCDIDIVGMAMILPDHNLHQRLANSLTDTISEIQKIKHQ